MLLDQPEGTIDITGEDEEDGEWESHPMFVLTTSKDGFMLISLNLKNIFCNVLKITF